jgi:hypothetical protein
MYVCFNIIYFPNKVFFCVFQEKGYGTYLRGKCIMFSRKNKSRKAISPNIAYTFLSAIVACTSITFY